MPERTNAPETVLFEETQRPGGWLWLALAAGGIGMLVATGSLIRMGTPGRTPGLIGLAVGLAALTMAAASKLVTRVTTAGADVRFPPMPWAAIRLRPADIAEVTTKRFGLFDWPGGVGYHVSWRTTAATARTGTGVLVRRSDGRLFLIGTERPEALAAALRQLQGEGAH